MGAAASAAAGGETAYQLWAWGYCARKPVPCVYPYNNPPYRLEAEPGDWLKVVVGAKGGHAINDSGELFGWGYGAKGRIGVGNTTTYSGNGTPPYVQIGTDTDHR